MACQQHWHNNSGIGCFLSHSPHAWQNSVYHMFEGMPDKHAHIHTLGFNILAFPDFARLVLGFPHCQLSTQFLSPFRTHSEAYGQVSDAHESHKYDKNA